ncbi:stachyose synthase [Mangifera indica]|uniref:stachyose synthase n=1 Tax=Mangifera indica TaxID=29780 RepID=UPI001CFBCE44|nr:stachyose synthase [Mangifera indica]
MAPPNDPPKPLFVKLGFNSSEKYLNLSNGNLNVKDFPVLSDVPRNVTFSPFSSICKYSDAPVSVLQRVQAHSHKGGFLGFKSQEESDRLMNSLGRFSGRDFLSIFRFKTWWSTQWVGASGSDLQMETQWVLLDVPEIRSHVIIIPIIDGSFRSALHPGKDGHVMICAESGSTRVKASKFDAIAYVHVSDNPYNIMKEAYSALRVHLNTFRLLEEKQVPSLVDKFGWCTWDAFYLTVEPAGIWHGVKEFANGGLSPRFLIIDDGWQSINRDDEDPNQDSKNLVLGGEQMTARLHRLNEGEKFRKYKRGSLLSPKAPSFDPNKPKMLIAKAIELEHANKNRDKAIQSGVNDLSEYDSKIKKLQGELEQLFGEESSSSSSANEGCGSCSCKDKDYGLKALTRDLRTKFKNLDDIWVWHALCGAWGGVRPGTTHLNSKIAHCKVSPGLDGTMNDLAVVKIVEGGIGLVHPSQAHDFYNSMHSSLAESGITGVKVDVIHTLEYVSEDYGGRVQLAKAYYNGLSDSLVNNFNGTGIICSMQQCNDFFFVGTHQISMGRVGDDFWFQDPNGDPNGVYWLQGVHMIHCSYNSLWMGQFIQPDWDMFQSDHCCAKFHAGSRAICGGPVYVSDSVGGHNFDLLKQLVYSDGTIPKCQYFALPTRDCLFKNPLFDHKTILKIWNFNKYGGVIGAFNCQGAGWDGKELRIKGYPECFKPVSGSVHVTDIEWDQKAEAAHMGEAEEYIVYLNQAEKLLFMTPKSDAIQITIQPSSFELFSFVPIKKLGPGIKFAPIGLINMFNCGGTIRELEFFESGADVSVKIEAKGEGNFLAYSSEPPKKCFLNGAEVSFEWSSEGKLTLNLPWIEEAGGISDVAILF